MTIKYDYDEYPDAKWLENEMDGESQQKRHSFVLTKCTGSILDVGAGVGTLARKAKKENKEVTCVDIKKEYVDYMKSLGLNAYRADARSLNHIFKEGSYDTVVLSEILEHLPNPGNALNEAVRIARKKIIITIPINLPDEWHFWNFKHTVLGGRWLVLEMERAT